MAQLRFPGLRKVRSPGIHPSGINNGDLEDMKNASGINRYHMTNQWIFHGYFMDISIINGFKHSKW